MVALLVIIHVVCCLGLIAIVLLQAGKGAGLASTFGAQAVESALGAGASDFLKKVTTVMAVIFMLTSLSLAFFTARKSASVVREVKPPAQQQQGGTVSRQIRMTPEGEQVVDEKILPGLEGKSKEELQKILKEITETIPAGSKRDEAPAGDKPAVEAEPVPEEKPVPMEEQKPSKPVAETKPEAAEKTEPAEVTTTK